MVIGHPAAVCSPADAHHDTALVNCILLLQYGYPAAVCSLADAHHDTAHHRSGQPRPGPALPPGQKLYNGNCIKGIVSQST